MAYNMDTSQPSILPNNNMDTSDLSILPNNELDACSEYSLISADGGQSPLPKKQNGLIIFADVGVETDIEYNIDVMSMEEYISFMKKLLTVSYPLQYSETCNIRINIDNIGTINPKLIMSTVRQYYNMSKFLSEIGPIYDFCKANNSTDIFYDILTNTYSRCKDATKTTDTICDIMKPNSNFRYPKMDIKNIINILIPLLTSLDELTALHNFQTKNNIDEDLIDLYQLKFALKVKPHDNILKLSNTDVLRDTPDLSHDDAIVPQEKFRRNFNTFTLGIFDELSDWTNIYISGGSLHNMISARLRKLFVTSDIDIFVTGADLIEKKATIARLLKYLGTQLQKRGSKAYFCIKETVITIFTDEKIFQIHCSAYATISQVLSNFDHGYVKMEYGNGNVLSTYSAILSLTGTPQEIGADIKPVRLYKLISNGIAIPEKCAPLISKYIANDGTLDCKALREDPIVQENYYQCYHPQTERSTGQNIYELKIHYNFDFVSCDPIECLNNFKDSDYNALYEKAFPKPIPPPVQKPKYPSYNTNCTRYSENYGYYRGSCS